MPNCAPGNSSSTTGSESTCHRSDGTPYGGESSRARPCSLSADERLNSSPNLTQPPEPTCSATTMPDCAPGNPTSTIGLDGSYCRSDGLGYDGENSQARSLDARSLYTYDSKSVYDFAYELENVAGTSDSTVYKKTPCKDKIRFAFSARRPEQKFDLEASRLLLPKPSAAAKPRGKKATTEYEPRQQPQVSNPVDLGRGARTNLSSVKQFMLEVVFPCLAAVLLVGVVVGITLGAIYGVRARYDKQHYGCNPHPRIVSQVRNGTDRLTTIIESENSECRMGPEHMDWVYFNPKLE